jgi:hypothetical protein
MRTKNYSKFFLPLALNKRIEDKNILETHLKFLIQISNCSFLTFQLLLQLLNFRRLGGLIKLLRFRLELVQLVI